MPPVGYDTLLSYIMLNAGQVGVGRLRAYKSAVRAYLREWGTPFSKDEDDDLNAILDRLMQVVESLKSQATAVATTEEVLENTEENAEEQNAEEEIEAPPPVSAPASVPAPKKKHVERNRRDRVREGDAAEEAWGRRTLRP